MQRLRPWGMRSAMVGTFVVCGVASASAQGGPYFVPPPSPLAPTTAAQCNALDMQWNAIRREISTRHSVCLDANSKSDGRTESGRQCSYAVCEPFHNSFELGRAEVDRCREQVRAYLAEERRREEERRRLEEEREREAREAENARREQARQAEERRQREEREAAEMERERERREQERERQRQSDARAIESAQRADAASKAALDAANANRDQEAEKLGEVRSEANDRLGYALDRIRQAAEGAVGALREATRAPNQAAIDGRPASTAQFDIPGAPDENDTYGKIASMFTTLGGTVVPWGGVNFGIIDNAAQQTIGLVNEIGRAVDNFDHDDGGRLAAALERFPNEVLGPKIFLKTIAENAVSTLAADALMRNVIDPAREALAVGWRTGIDERNPAALFVPTPEAGTPQTYLYHWRSYGPAKEARLIRDDRGTALLYDQRGRPVLYDATRGRAEYDTADLEAIVARTNALPRWEVGGEWRENAIVFLPSAAPERSSYSMIPEEWIIGSLTGQAVSSAMPNLSRLADPRRPE